MGTGSISLAVPAISLVVPTYGVAAYLPDFLASLDRQDTGGARVEFVFVDDGSPDDSAAIVTDWIGRRGAHGDRRARGERDDAPTSPARLVRQANGGLSAARNAGLDAATGDWVTFPDPDDVLDDGYLGVMTRFVTSPQADTVHVVAGRPIFYDDPVDGSEGTYRDAHPLRHRFDDGTRVVDLVREPQYFPVAANTGLFRRAVLDAFGLRFDGSVRPVWEDGHLTARYLSKFERPRVALMADARYYYRLRADSSSLMDGQWSDPDKFVTVPRKGWLDALETTAAEHGGQAPAWMQNMVVYDVRGYFKNERKTPSPTATTPREVSDEFFAILRDCFRHIELDVLDRFRGPHITHEVREVLRSGFAGAPQRPDEIAVDRLDADRGIVRLHYFYAGDAPDEQLRARGLLVAPVYAATRPCTFYGRTFAHERVVWLPADGTLSVTLDGRPVPLRPGPLELRRLDLRPARVREALGTTGPARPTAPATPTRTGLRPRLGRARRELRTAWQHQRDDAERRRTEARAAAYAGAWLLRGHPERSAGRVDTLYRWLQTHQPGLNAWLVVPAGSGAERPADELPGAGSRVLEHGSTQYRLACEQARHLVSARPEKAVGRAHVTYLPDDALADFSPWQLDGGTVDLMLVAAQEQFDAIVDDASPWLLGDREVRLIDVADGTGCRRAYEAIESLSSPLGHDRLYRSLEPRSVLDGRPVADELHG